MKRKLELIRPGEVLKEEFMMPLAISQRGLADDLSVPLTRVAAVIAGTRAIDADLALRLAAYFGTSAEMWLKLQMEFDLRRAQADSGSVISRTVKRRVAA